MRLNLLAIVLLFLACANDASATTTVCSNPSRVRTFDRLAVSIPNGDQPAFAALIRKFERETDMSLGEVQSLSGDVVVRHRIIFQSPRVSVVIRVTTERADAVARVSVERTCINDALEDWKPYWKAFRQFLDKNGLQQVKGSH